nr:immunoglobulin heavy chain junction region [Mus musculus]
CATADYEGYYAMDYW